MWIPRTEEELRAALEDGALTENERLEVKRQTPGKKKAVDVAIDVAALANDGGVLIYGVAENEDGRPASLAPLENLERERSRIDQQIQHGVGGSLAVQILPVHAGDPQDNRGYLVVVVPMSPEAPHLVLGEQRFYGRGPTGNRLLTQAEIDRLYERRRRWEIDLDSMLSEAVASFPERLTAQAGVLVLVAKPVATDSGLLERIRIDPDTRLTRDVHEVMNGLVRRARSRLRDSGREPNLGSLGTWAEARGGGFEAGNWYAQEGKVKKALVLRIDGDGTLALFCGRAADKLGDRGFLLAERLIAALAAEVAVISAVVLREGDYLGSVGLGLWVSGIAEARSWALNLSERSFGSERVYGQDEFRESTRVAADDLISAPIEAAARIVLPLTRVVTGEAFDPFSEVRSTDGDGG